MMSERDEDRKKKKTFFFIDINDSLEKEGR